MVESGWTRYSGLGLLVVATGVLITRPETTIVVLALPEIQRSLQVGLASVIWVIIGYLLVITLLSTQVDCGGRGHEPRHRVSRVGLGGVVVRSGRRV